MILLSLIIVILGSYFRTKVDFLPGGRVVSLIKTRVHLVDKKTCYYRVELFSKQLIKQNTVNVNISCRITCAVKTICY